MATRDLGFVHRFAPAQARAAPTLLLLHGATHSEIEMLPLGRELAPEAALLSPRGKVQNLGKPHFCRRRYEGGYDQNEMAHCTQELADFVRAAAETYSFDTRRIVAVGHSSGANVAVALLLLCPGLLSAAVLLHPMLPMLPEKLPDLDGVPVLITAGRSDPVVPPEETERLSQLLQLSGADVDLLWKDEHHALTTGDVRTARNWLQARQITPTRMPAGLQAVS